VLRPLQSLISGGLSFSNPASTYSGFFHQYRFNLRDDFFINIASNDNVIFSST